MISIALAVSVAVVATPVNVQQLPNHSADSVRTICVRQHGTFYNHGGLFGCAMARGTVQCDGAHCVGYPRRRQLPRSLPEEPWPQQQW